MKKCITWLKTCIMNFIKWVKPAWEGPDGLFSWRRATISVSMALIIYLVVWHEPLDYWGFMYMIALMIFILLLGSLIQFSQLSELAKLRFGNLPAGKEVTVEKIEKTIMSNHEVLSPEEVIPKP